MAGHEQADRELGVSALHEDPAAPDRDKALRVRDIINTLTTELPNGGWLSTLVFNTRNTYFGLPGSTFSSEHMQMIVEGFLAEIVTLRSQVADNPSQPSQS